MRGLKRMKRILTAFLCACMIAITASGCGYTDALDKASSNTEATQATEATGDDEIKSEDYKNDLEGLSDYFADKKYIAVDKKGEIDKNYVTEMDASLIGAKSGKKYKYGAITVELYEFDKTDGNVYKSVKETGKFTILDLPEVTAHISDNGKFVLIYTDKTIDEAKTEADNYKKRQTVIDDFKAFNK